MKKVYIQYTGLLLTIFGIFTMLPRYADFSNFPFSLTPVSILGLFMLVGGLTLMFYGSQ